MTRGDYAFQLRTPDYAWWKPLVGLLSLAAGLLLVVPVVLAPVLIVVVTLQGGDGTNFERVSAAMGGGHVTPASMLYLNLSLASLAVLAMLVVRWVHGISPRRLTSVAPGLRWRFFAACLAAAVAAVAGSLLLQSVLPGVADVAQGSAGLPSGQLMAVAVVIVLTTPLQALGEEYAFRGYLLQSTGALFGSRLVALALSSALFAVAHGTQNLPLFIDRLTFGLMAGLTALAVGGLEAGIALHAVNNLVAFGIAVAYGQVGSALAVTTASWWQLPQTLVQNGLFLVLVLLLARRWQTTGPHHSRPTTLQA